MSTEQLSDQKQKDLIENCDAMIWASEVKAEENAINTQMNFYRTKNKIKPTDMGYKYNVLQFKQGDVESIEVFSAIIGDQRAYAERLGKMGYNGMMFKQRSCAKREMKELFQKSLMHWGFEEKEIKPILKTMVC